MLCRSSTWLICMFVATVYSQTDYTKEWSVPGSNQKIKQMATEDLGALLDGREGTVVTLVAGDTQLVAHRAVLADRSPVLADMLCHSAAVVSSGRLVIPDMEGPVLRQVVAYLYTLQVPRLRGMARQLLAAAERFQLPALKAYCRWQVAAQLSVETAAAVAVLAMEHSYNELRDAALNFIKYHVFEVLATKGWADVVAKHPKEAIEVSRLLAGRLAETSSTTEGRSTATAEDGTTATTEGGTTATNQTRSDFCQTPTTAAAAHTVEDAIITSLRRLPDLEKGRRLIQAAEMGAVVDLRRLLAAGADPGVRDESVARITALHAAARTGLLEAVTALVEAGAEVDACNSIQNTALHWAAGNGQTAVVQLLLALRANPNARDVVGWSPLHYAAWRGHTEAVAALLQRGANRWARTDDGQTALDIAKHYHDQETIELLTIS